jgi:fatty-acyl-CoA synthase
MAAMTHGASLVYPAAGFDAGMSNLTVCPFAEAGADLQLLLTEATLRAVHEERCTALHGVPTMFIQQLNHPAFQSFNLSSLRTVCDCLKEFCFLSVSLSFSI